ncbi:MAG: TrbG/VirB9 family P-type conjugative transfer protein [Gammaproteobacteria bacterium]
MCFASTALASSTPVDVTTDSRVKKVMYNPEQVYEIRTSYGVSSTILFGDDEKVTAVSLGDPTVWQVTPMANSLNIKPIALNPDTNMTVWTDKHIYLFNLHAIQPQLDDVGHIVKPASTRGLLYMLRFTYPKVDFMTIPKSDIASNTYTPACNNRDYTAYGDKAVSPTKVCDDGRFTYFAFTEHQNHPAILMVDEYGLEHAVNFRQSGQFLVIERLAAQFSLRYGDSVSTVFNELPPKELMPEV